LKAKKSWIDHPVQTIEKIEDLPAEQSETTSNAVKKNKLS
jgi:hypothetical protein